MQFLPYPIVIYWNFIIEIVFNRCPNSGRFLAAPLAAHYSVTSAAMSQPPNPTRRVSFSRSGSHLEAGTWVRVSDCVLTSGAGDPRRGGTSFVGVLFVERWITALERAKRSIGKCDIRRSAHPWNNGGSTEMALMRMVTVMVMVTGMGMRMRMPMGIMMVWLWVDFSTRFDYNGTVNVTTLTVGIGPGDVNRDGDDNGVTNDDYAIES